MSVIDHFFSQSSEGHNIGCLQMSQERSNDWLRCWLDTSWGLLRQLLLLCRHAVVSRSQLLLARGRDSCNCEKDKNRPSIERESTGSRFTSTRRSKSMVSLSERVSGIDSFHTEWRDGSGAEAQTRDTPWWWYLGWWRTAISLLGRSFNCIRLFVDCCILSGNGGRSRCTGGRNRVLGSRIRANAFISHNR